MSDSSGDIIIKGGSVDLTFDPITYTKELDIDSKTWKNLDKKIIQIIVTNENNETAYDSGEDLQGLKYTIRVRCR